MHFFVYNISEIEKKNLPLFQMYLSLLTDLILPGSGHMLAGI